MKFCVIALISEVLLPEFERIGLQYGDFAFKF